MSKKCVLLGTTHILRVYLSIEPSHPEVQGMNPASLVNRAECQRKMIMITLILFTMLHRTYFAFLFSMKSVLHPFFIFNFCFEDFPFSEDQDEVPFFYDDSIALGDAPRDWTLPSVSTFHGKQPQYPATRKASQF